MTYATAITAPAATEEPQEFTHSPVSRSFSALLLALRAAVEAEIKTLETDIYTTAFKVQVHSAFNDWCVVFNFVRQVLTHDPTRHEDDELRHVAALVGISTYLEHSEDCRAYNLLIRDYLPIFHCSAETPAGRRTIQMIDIARDRFRKLDRAVLSSEREAEAPAVRM